MPSKPKPKTFRAVRDFTVGGVLYPRGAVIPPTPLLARLLSWGGFVTSGPPVTDTTITEEDHG